MKRHTPELDRTLYVGAAEALERFVGAVEQGQAPAKDDTWQVGQSLKRWLCGVPIETAFTLPIETDTKRRERYTRFVVVERYNELYAELKRKKVRGPRDEAEARVAGEFKVSPKTVRDYRKLPHSMLPEPPHWVTMPEPFEDGRTWRLAVPIDKPKSG